jgi:creatinine amidohydrolase
VNYLLPTITTLDVKKSDSKVALLPIGSFEQHGGYLPLITDTVIATTICQELVNSYSVLELPL